MKLAVVINVSPEQAAIRHAIDTQKLLLEGLGVRLESIRLAAPRLLHNACASALAEKPDVLVAIGGPRAARRAGQVAYQQGAPILFLPGFRAPEWARQLWNGLSFENMVAALSRGDLRPVQIRIAMAEDQIFFEQASCGLLPHLPELRAALEDADSIDETWRVLARAGQLLRFVLRPGVRFRPGDGDADRAAALLLEMPEMRLRMENWRDAALPAFRCSAIHRGAVAQLAGLVRDGFGGWRRGRKQEFECTKLVAEAGRPSWILLDGDPVRFERPVQFRFAANSVQTFMFNPPQRHANDNSRNRGQQSLALEASPEPAWNRPGASHVAMPEPRTRYAQR
jgi:hypothetical protein